MFEKGNFVMNTNNGICEITDIVTLNMSGSNKEYYVLVPIAESSAKIFIPIDTAEKRIRLAMTQSQAEEFIKTIKDIDEVYLENEKEREKTYKDALNSLDPKRLVGIIKTLYLRKQKRLETGKKNTSVDERYFKLAENHLHNELAFSLGVSKSEVNDIIIANL